MVDGSVFSALCRWICRFTRAWRPGTSRWPAYGGGSRSCRDLAWDDELSGQRLRTRGSRHGAERRCDPGYQSALSRLSPPMNGHCWSRAATLPETFG